jgi:hypothetical protein
MVIETNFPLPITGGLCYGLAPVDSPPHTPHDDPDLGLLQAEYSRARLQPWGLATAPASRLTPAPLTLRSL